MDLDCAATRDLECDYGLYVEPDRPPCTSPRRGTRTTSYGACTLQLGAAQDFSTTGTTDEGWYGVVADGHGRTNRVIELLRGMDWGAVVSRPRPMEYVLERVKGLGDTVNDGSTLSLARTKNGSLVLSWIGDSAMAFYSRGSSPSWQSPIHSVNVPSERDALIRRGARITHTNSSGRGIYVPEVLTPTSATLVPSRAVAATATGSPGEDLDVSLSRALGHNTEGGGAQGPSSVLLSEPQHHTITLPAGMAGRLVMGSAGLWKVLAPPDYSWLSSGGVTAELVADRARQRWKQEWTCRLPGSMPLAGSRHRPTKMTMPRAEDVSVVVWNGTG